MLAALGLWVCLCPLFAYFGTGQINSLPVAAAASVVATGVGQWLYLLPWMLTRPDSAADFAYGLARGGALVSVIAMIVLLVAVVLAPKML